jgi:receptor expression-enhancing protein 5/6
VVSAAAYMGLHIGFLVHGLFALLVNACSFLIPAFYSYKALESSSGLETWLTYWVVLGALSVVEHWTYFLVTRIPFWVFFKLVLIIWLQFPATQVRGDALRQFAERLPVAKLQPFV